MESPSALSPHPEGVRLAVRITPRAVCNAIEGLAADAAGRFQLRVRLSAAPVDGAANDALVDLLAGKLRMRKRDIVILSGTTGRSKIILLKGDAATIAERIAALAT